MALEKRLIASVAGNQAVVAASPGITVNRPQIAGFVAEALA